MPNICPSVCLCISTLKSEAKSKEGLLPVQSVCLCVCNQGVYADNDNANACGQETRLLDCSIFFY